MASSRVTVNLRKNSTLNENTNFNRTAFPKRKYETSPSSDRKKPAFNNVANGKLKPLESKRVKTESAENTQHDLTGTLARGKNKLTVSRAPLGNLSNNAVNGVKVASKKSTNTVCPLKAELHKPVTRSSILARSFVTAKVSSFRKPSVAPREEPKPVLKSVKVADTNAKKNARIAPSISVPKIETVHEQLAGKVETHVKEQVVEIETRYRRSVKTETAEFTVKELCHEIETRSKRSSKTEPKECTQLSEKLHVDIETKSKRSVKFESTVEPPAAHNELETKPPRRSSTRLSCSRKSLTLSSADKSDENGSLYISALEDITNTSSVELKSIAKPREIPEFDKELLHDPQQVALYAMEIFDYLKSREANFTILDYMPKQKNINEKMRATLVDWMVEVQENFELNHETLYLSVKILDTYLSKVEIIKDLLQLVAAASLFLSCKYDERLSPLLDDFVYICDGAYTQNDLLEMEQDILAKLKFELSFPISYSFLRRYARCARVQMPLLTLARFILELSLMEYKTVLLSDSKQAAAALYLAFRMTKHSEWTVSLEYYTGYKVEDFKDIVKLFNSVLHQKVSKDLLTIRTKYSHKLFFEVAKTPLLSDSELNL